MDRARRICAHKRSVRAHFGAVTFLGALKNGPRWQQTPLYDPAEGNARFGTPGFGDFDRIVVRRHNVRNALARDARIVRVTLDSDETTRKSCRNSASRARPKKRIEDDVARLARCDYDAMKQRLRFLRGVRLSTIFVFEAFCTGANRNSPIRTHLKLVIQRLHRFVIERVGALRSLGRPDESFVRVGETPSAKIWHRVRLAPDDIVENPESEVLQDRADTEDVVIRADDPEPT